MAQPLQPITFTNYHVTLALSTSQPIPQPVFLTDFAILQRFATVPPLSSLIIYLNFRRGISKQKYTPCLIETVLAVLNHCKDINWDMASRGYALDFCQFDKVSKLKFFKPIPPTSIASFNRPEDGECSPSPQELCSRSSEVIAHPGLYYASCLEAIYPKVGHLDSFSCQSLRSFLPLTQSYGCTECWKNWILPEDLSDQQRVISDTLNCNMAPYLQPASPLSSLLLSHHKCFTR